MKYVDEFRNQRLCLKLAEKISELDLDRPLNIMEVCGTHTHNFFRFGLDKITSKNLRLISGPGCPVCVSSQQYIDQAIAYAGEKNIIVATFGDMLRVPGTRSTLEQARAFFSNVKILYSPLDSLKLAKAYPAKRIVFLAVGFETTIPTIALSVLLAKKAKLENLFFFSSLKLIPPVMGYLLQDKRLRLDGFLCPGHVSVVIGSEAYAFIPKKWGLACCVAGFEPLDILEGLYLLARQVVHSKAKVDNQYIRAVTKNGNRKARQLMHKVFKVEDAEWRGLGKIAASGMGLRNEFRAFDASAILGLRYKHSTTNDRARACRCADVLKGIIIPKECPMFASICNPDNPQGPCMVSQEGACNAYYKYK